MPLAEAAATSAISFLWAIPFVALLVTIGVMPLVHKHWWEKGYPWITLALAVVGSSYYFLGKGDLHRWIEGMEEYVSFIILLAALFVVSGGIAINVTRQGTPLANSVLLLIGAALANLFGTTGAAMLLIRPYLRMNERHLKPYHVVFFIFIVANVGGSLTPIGDPPLFLGYLMGVPFWWVFQHMHGVWLLVVGLLLLIFFILDTADHRREERHRPNDVGPTVGIVGIHNFLFILVVVAAVFQPGAFSLVHSRSGLALLGNLALSREVLMVAAAVASWLVTSGTIYKRNQFSFAPIREVTILFAGIFATMIPAIQFMQANAASLPLKTPGQVYFVSGVLSSLLDNAPTYKTFVDTRLAEIPVDDVVAARTVLKAMSAAHSTEIPADLPPGRVRHALEAVARYHSGDVLSANVSDEELRIGFLIGVPAWSIYLFAISASSVLWGACTYIGNGPNLMIKSIADAAGANSPSFGSYMLKYTLPVLIPIYILVWAIYLRG